MRCSCKALLGACAITTIVYTIHLHSRLAAESENVWERENARLPSPRQRPNEPHNVAICFSDSCLDVRAARIARVWPSKPYKSWCYLDELAVNGHGATNNSTASFKRGGLRLIKVPKSASSTVAGVVLRIQNRRKCERPVRWEHGRARDDEIQLNNPSVFRVAPIRLAGDRALSNVYFHDVSFHGSHRKREQKQKPRDAHIMRGLRQTPNNYILDYVTTNGDFNVSDTINTTILLAQPEALAKYIAALETHVQKVLIDYDFLIVVDRMTESLAVWSMLTELPIQDFLSLSTKLAGTWYAVGYNQKRPRCIQLVAPTSTPALDQFFASQTWQIRQAGDRLLHKAAAASLDQTIESLGAHRVKAVIDEYQTWQRLVQQSTCVRNNSFFPCTLDGTPQINYSRRHCYARDFGCGFPCIDSLVDKGLKH
jgi:hypothetical protein